MEEQGSLYSSQGAGRGAWGWVGGSLTRRTQEDVHQVLIEDEGGRPLGEQVETD